ncbi:hypothetical protein [Nesterenkonia ebinurensis]|uniref:hypothetical protein n=1 Tax=Nesterenkonia ebinurensis TaxID=2608252 RepID=UPI00123C9D1C|nr:hypothetical protein [Nesterenkonia ebinurensis]
MSNLGDYQDFVTIAKKVGGPKNLVGLVLSVGACAGLGIGYAYGRSTKARIKQTAPCLGRRKLFAVTADAEDPSSGLAVREGDSYRVLEADGEAIQIQVIGDENNPYFVSQGFLASISDFPKTDDVTD